MFVYYLACRMVLKKYLELLVSSLIQVVLPKFLDALKEGNFCFFLFPFKCFFVLLAHALNAGLTKRY